MKISKEILLTLDSLFFMPLKQNETLEIRDESIKAFLKSKSITWDDILDNINYEEKYE
jgi:hypothetical protein